MAKRYVEECDLCKKEAELDNSLTIKPTKSKKAGRSYDVCDACKELLEKALISSDGLAQLMGAAPVSKRGTPEIQTESKIAPDELELPDGTVRKIPSKVYGESVEGKTSGAFETDLPKTKNKDGEPCLHMNKSRPRINSKTSEVEQHCKDCDVELPYKSAQAKAKELSVTPPSND
jgi:hypothetical protein